MEIKICYACKKEKPTSEFYTNKTKKDGFSDECKICVREYGTQRRKKLKEKNKTIKTEFRVCPECGEKKHRSNFHSAASNMDGLSTYCKPCRTKLRTKKHEDKNCKICGKTFLPQKDDRLYCSRKCGTEAWWNGLTEEERTQKVKEYSQRNYTNNKTQYKERGRKLSKKYIKEVHFCYAKSLIADNYKLKYDSIPDEFVRSKQIEIKVKRLLKIKKYENTKTS